MRDLLTPFLLSLTSVAKCNYSFIFASLFVWVMFGFFFFLSCPSIHKGSCYFLVCFLTDLPILHCLFSFKFWSTEKALLYSLMFLLYFCCIWMPFRNFILWSVLSWHLAYYFPELVETLLKFRVWILLTSCIPCLKITNSIISSSLPPKFPINFTHTNNYTLLVRARPKINDIQVISSTFWTRKLFSIQVWNLPNT